MSDMKNIEEKIFDYIEDNLSPGEKAQFEQLLAQDATLKAEVEAIVKADALMLENRLELRLDDQFADNVIAKIGQAKNRFKTSNRILWLALSMFGLVVVAVVIMLPAMQTGGGGYLVPEEWLPTMPAFDGSKVIKMIDNPALIQLALIINAIALLLVLDRVLSNKLKVDFKN